VLSRLTSSVVLAVVTLSASLGIAVAAVSPDKIAHSIKIRSIDEVRSEALTMPKLQVQGTGTPITEEQFVLADLPGSADSSSNSSAGHPAYKTGKGVVMNVVTPFHTDTNSGLAVLDTVWNYNAAYLIKNNASNAFLITTMPRRVQSWPNISCCFGKLATTSKTYLLTLGMQLGNTPIKIKVGDNEFQSNQFTTNPVTNDTRLVFTYAAPNVDSLLYIHVFYAGPVNSSVPPLGYKFYYVQLMQLD
jgi:hypothetical protein